MSALLNAAVAVALLASIVLTALGALAWYRARRARLGLLAIGFAAFASGFGVLAAWLFRGTDTEAALTTQTLLSAIGLLFIYLAAVKR